METAPVAAPAAAAAPAAPAVTPSAAAALSTPAVAAPPVEAPVAAPKATPSVSPHSTETPKSTWTEGLPADLQEYVSGKGFQDTKAVLESYRNLEKLRGVPQERLLKLPESPEAEGWNDVFMKLGKPATSEGYGLEVAEGGDPAFTNWAKDNFLELNLTKEQGTGLIEKFKAFTADVEAREQEAYTLEVQEQTQTLKREWGGAYEQNIARAQSAYRQFGLNDKALSSLEKAVGFDGVMKFMLDLGSRVGEHGYVGSTGSDGFGDTILTPVQAKEKIKALKADPDFRVRYLKGETKAKAELSRLHQMASASD